MIENLTDKIELQKELSKIGQSSNVILSSSLSSSLPVVLTSDLLHKYLYLNNSERNNQYIKRENIRFIYNYYDQIFQNIDDVMKIANYDEKSLPNYYFDFFSVSGNIKKDEYEKLPIQKRISAIINQNYETDPRTFINEVKKVAEVNKQQNILFDRSLIDRNKNDLLHNDKASLMPYYQEVQFDRETTNRGFKNIFKSWGEKTIVSNTLESQGKILPPITSVSLFDLDNTNIINEKGDKVADWSANSAWTSYLKPFDFSLDTVTGNNSFTYPVTLNSKNFSNNLKIMASQVSTKKIIQEYNKNPDLFINKSDTVFYKIIKLDDATKKVIQTIYIPNDDNFGDKISYIDSQVFLDKTYTYEIYCIKLTILDSQLYIFEVPYLTDVSVTPSDYFYPIEPDVQIIPYKGVSDKLLFMFENGIGEYIKPIQSILPSDTFGSEVALVDLINNNSANKAMELDMKYELAEGSAYIEEYFRQSSPVNKIQIFRSETKPNKYSDLSSSLYHELDFSSSTAWVDNNIEPNKKYYYCFRSMNIKNRRSNPTYVYEVEIVKNSGAVYPKLNYFLPTNKTEPVYQKEFTRFVYLKPNQDFFIPNSAPDKPYEASPFLFLTQKLIEQIEQLGINSSNQNADASSMNFKIRITSKTTKKSIDYNITFSKKGIVIDLQKLSHAGIIPAGH